MNATLDETQRARTRVTPGATPQTPLRLLQTPCRPVAVRSAAVLPSRDWLARLSSWMRAGR